MSGVRAKGCVCVVMFRTHSLERTAYPTVFQFTRVLPLRCRASFSWPVREAVSAMNHVQSFVACMFDSFTLSASDSSTWTELQVLGVECVRWLIGVSFAVR